MSGNKEITKNRTAAFRLVYVQLIITVVIALLSYTYSGLVSAYSVLLGGAVYILPNIYFVICVFRDMDQEDPFAIARLFYYGETMKLLLTVVIFALCFTLVKPLHAVSLFATYILVMIVNMAGLAILSKNWKKRFNNK
ncbi:MAG: ATP synthase subunit I [Gammaproteobacteria bacterium]|nr:ATP synthase subunit I [Gammaproteobacteria bacterium]MCK5669355.1 ATP synthase subunit I [Gammaproteobacteria bacterium]